MTQAETNQLLIEFERRLQITDPTTAIKAKLDTQTIESFLNEYQLTYIKQLILALDQAEKGSAAEKKISDTLSYLITKTDLTYRGEDDERISVYEMPNKYLMYIRSTSDVTSTFRPQSTRTGVISNVFSKNAEDVKQLSLLFNRGAIIKNPIIVEEGDHFLLVKDMYTTINDVLLTYYRQPNHFTVLSTEVVPCELPQSCAEELVLGAVDLFLIKYKYELQLAASRNRQNNKREQEAER